MQTIILHYIGLFFIVKSKPKLSKKALAQKKKSEKDSPPEPSLDDAAGLVDPDSQKPLFDHQAKKDRKRNINP